MNKKIGFIGIIVGMCIMGMANLVFASIGSEGKAAKQPRGIEVVVKQGDTLWSIADRYNEQADMSVQELLYYIKEENKLTSAIVQDGDKIIVPIQS
jgi:hypothetical protein